jgi:hypothetical protein
MNRLSFAVCGAGFVIIATLAAPPVRALEGLVEKTHALPALPLRPPGAVQDWLVQPLQTKAALYQASGGKDLVLDNGLIRRTFRVIPNAATVALDNLATGASVIRAVKPEALISVNGRSLEVGGLAGQPEQAYLLPEWVDQMKAATGALQCVDFEIGPTQARFGWKRTRHASDLPWPPPGAAVHFRFSSEEQELQGLTATVHYELYDGMPVFAKWITVRNGTGRPLSLDSFTSELLATAEVESAVDERAFRNWRLPALDLLSDFSFHGMDATTASQTTVWHFCCRPRQ